MHATKYVKPINKNEKKIDCGTRGDRSIPLGPVYISNGEIWNPKKGKLWKLCQWNNKTESWPGLPDGDKYICFHDSYPFIGIPWGIAREYDEKREKWLMFGGHFCSPNCQQRYLNDNIENMGLNCRTATWMFNTKVRGLPLLKIINLAAPKEWTKRWQPESGMEIEEFRKKFINSKINLLPKNLVSSITLIEEIRYRREDNNSHNKRVRNEKRKRIEQEKKRIKLQNNPFSSRKFGNNNISNNTAILNIFKRNTRTNKKK